ncbi:hypothetical protein ID866_10480 [Astraeus odoratus]|nr:hypothetical protein ID866_10480 [Astraeus odoratus]
MDVANSHLEWIASMAQSNGTTSSWRGWWASSKC